MPYDVKEFVNIGSGNGLLLEQNFGEIFIKLHIFVLHCKHLECL